MSKRIKRHTSLHKGKGRAWNEHWEGEGLMVRVSQRRVDGAEDKPTTQSFDAQKSTDSSDALSETNSCPATISFVSPLRRSMKGHYHLSPQMSAPSLTQHPHILPSIQPSLFVGPSCPQPLRPSLARTTLHPLPSTSTSTHLLLLLLLLS